MYNDVNNLQHDEFLIQTSLGDLRGIKNGEVIQFRGVPYAEPPVGELRFSLPCTSSRQWEK